MIDFGALYPVAVDVYDDAGALTNADTVTLTITLPDGTTVTPTVTNPPTVTGQYRYAYPTTQAGRHIVKMVTASPVSSWRDVFDVSEDQPPSIMSLADAKMQLGIDPTDTSDDDELRMWIAGTTRAVEMAKNETIARRTVTWTGMNYHSDSLRLVNVPVISLDSLALWDGTHTWDVATDVITDLETGIVELITSPGLRGRLTATYTAGCAVIPYNIMQASLVLLQHVWESQRGPGTIGGGVIGPEEAADFKQAMMLPRKVREWLGPPRPAVF